MMTDLPSGCGIVGHNIQDDINQFTKETGEIVFNRLLSSESLWLLLLYNSQ